MNSHDPAPIEPGPSEVTVWLRAVSRGDDSASEPLARTVFTELRALARAQLRRQPVGRTLQPTALVNEAYLRLVGRDDQDWQSRKHFLFVAARAMHDVIVEEARRKASARRGGEYRRVGPEALASAAEAPPEELLALEGALRKLEERSPDQARIVQLRFFVGLTESEIAAAMGVSERTVRRLWRLARMRLYGELAEEGA